MTQHLVLIDDDPLFAEALALNLEGDGFQVAHFDDPGRAREALLGPDAPPADLLIVDWRMPGMTGAALIQTLRESGSTVPSLCLTSHSSAVYEETAFSLGAVDFVDKTRGYTILRHRIGLALQRGAETTKPASAPSRIGPLDMDDGTARARWDGQTVDLTLGEFRIVARLVETPGLPVDARHLYDLVRGQGFHAGQGDDGYRTNVRAFMKRIRQKFKTIDERFDRIETRPGLGYAWRSDEEGAWA